MRLVLGICALVLAGVKSGPPIVDGRYYWGHEVNAFHPCEGDQEYWVIADSGLQAQLVQLVRDSTSRPYQPLFVRVEGEVVPGERDGFAADYDGLFRVYRLVSFSTDTTESCRV